MYEDESKDLESKIAQQIRWTAREMHSLWAFGQQKPTKLKKAENWGRFALKHANLP